LRKTTYALKQTWTLSLVVKCRTARLRRGQPRNRLLIIGRKNRIFFYPKSPKRISNPTSILFNE